MKKSNQTLGWVSSLRAGKLLHVDDVTWDNRELERAVCQSDRIGITNGAGVFMCRRMYEETKTSFNV